MRGKKSIGWWGLFSLLTCGKEFNTYEWCNLLCVLIREEYIRGSGVVSCASLPTERRKKRKENSEWERFDAVVSEDKRQPFDDDMIIYRKMARKTSYRVYKTVAAFDMII